MTDGALAVVGALINGTGAFVALTDGAVAVVGALINGTAPAIALTVGAIDVAEAGIKGTEASPPLTDDPVLSDGDWMKQIGRNLLDPADGFLRNASHLIHDRDPVFTEAWTTLLKTDGVQCVAIPAQSPNCNPHAERFVKTIRAECLDHFVIFGERHLRHLIREFQAHYLTERYHQGIGSQIILPKASPGKDNATLGAIGCRSRLGGVIDYYFREAA